jgi:hypothetical protein
MFIKIILASVILSFIVCCGAQIEPNPNANGGRLFQNLDDAGKLSPNLYRLPSGNIIKVTNISRIDFPESGAALVLYYKTDIQVSNMPELRNEVNEIWEVFRKDVESANVKGAAIRAVHDETEGYIKTGKGYGFVFIKNDDGVWHNLEDDNK